MSFVEVRKAAEFGFTGRIKRRRVSPAYWLGLLCVAFGMLLLPAIYAALIVAVACGVYYHVVHHVGMLRGGGHLFRLVLYATPAIAGGVLVLFMIKPLFSRRDKLAARPGGLF